MSENTEEMLIKSPFEMKKVKGGYIQLGVYVEDPRYGRRKATALLQIAEAKLILEKGGICYPHQYVVGTLECSRTPNPKGGKYPDWLEFEVFQLFDENVNVKWGEKTQFPSDVLQLECGSVSSPQPNSLERRDVRPSRFEAYIWSDSVADAGKIHTFVKERGISRVVHFTSFPNLVSILRRGKLLSVSEMVNNGIEYIANDERRLDGGGHINVSIERINASLFAAMECRAKENGRDLEPWCILEIDPICLEKQGVYFTVDNAASNYARFHGRGTGLDGLSKMFEKTIDSMRPKVDGQNEPHVIQREDGMPRCWPTSKQAEVLIPDELPVQLLYGIVFRYNNDKELAERKLSELGDEIQIPADISFRVEEKMFRGL